jgi:nickel-dependent lactate racemase
VSSYIQIPHDWKWPECNHPIEKWCKNCDFDCDTYERIPHFRKYKEIYMWTEKEFDKEMNKRQYKRNSKVHGK